MEIINRTIVNSKEITPIICKLFEENLNFILWSKQNVEVYDGLIRSLQDSGFYVVELKDIEGIARCYKESMDHVTIADDDLLNLSLAKSTGRKVAVFVNNLERLNQQALHFLVESVTFKRVTNVDLDKEDIFVSVGKLADNGSPNCNVNPLFQAVTSRFFNYTFD